MDTSTQEPTKPVAGNGTVTPAVAAIDPEHDIDAKSTILWLGVSFAFVVVTMFVLADVFSHSLFNERVDKIDHAPLNELTRHRAGESYWLANPLASTEDVSANSKKDGDLPAINAQIQATTDRAIQSYLR